MPSVMYRVWPRGWVCQAVRAPGVKRTWAQPTADWSSGLRMPSMWTVPVNQSLGPVAVWPPLGVNLTVESFRGAEPVRSSVGQESLAVTLAVMSPAASYPRSPTAGSAPGGWQSRPSRPPPGHQLDGMCAGWSRAQEDLDDAPLVHRGVAGGGLGQGQLEVEDLAGVDLAGPDAVDEVGQEPSYGGGAAVEVDLGEEQLVAGELDVVGDADVPDVAARAAGSDGLHHRLLGADGLDDRVRAESVGELRDARDAVGAAFLDDVGGADLAGQGLPVGVAAYGDDALGPELAGGEDAEEADGAVPDDSHGLAGS